MKSYAAKSFLRSFLMLIFILGVSAQIRASQNEERLLKHHASPNPQIEIFNLQVDGKPIEFDREFTAGEEWVKGLTFDIKNISGKAITFLEISLYMPPAKKGGIGGASRMFYYGTNTMMPNVKPENIRIAPGEVIHAGFIEKWYEPFKQMQKHVGLEKIVELGFRVERVIFEDELM